MTIRDELIDELLAGQAPASVMRQDGLLGALKKALLSRLMAAEFEHHVAQDRASGEGRNHRNGSTRKRVLTDDTHVEVAIPATARRGLILCWSAIGLLDLVLRRASNDRKDTQRNWTAAMTQFAIMFGDRFSVE
jgi:transposase-like protein